MRGSRVIGIDLPVPDFIKTLLVGEVLKAVVLFGREEDSILKESNGRTNNQETASTEKLHHMWFT